LSVASRDGLDHVDGVVDHDTEGEHHAEQRQRVDGEAQQREGPKGANERYRHGQHGDQCGAPALQEQEHHDQHQHQRLEEGVHHLLERRLDEHRVVEHHFVGQVVGEGGGQLFQALLDEVGSLDRARVGG
jgi:hypothetical protein